MDQGMRALPLSLLEDTPKAFETDGSMQLAMFEGVASPAEEMRTEPTDPDGTPADADEWQEVIDFDMAEPEPDAELTLGEMELDDATMDLMLEMGYQGTVRRTVSPERMNEFLLHERQRRQTPPPADAYAYEGEEYEKEEQAESIFRRYTHEKYMLLLRLLGSAAFFVLLLLYELLPLLGISFSNLPTFDDAPVATMYIGIQLLVLCGVFAWRELWGGLKKGLTLRAELWSVPALACVMNVIYSVAVLAVAQETTVHTFHTLTAFFILMGLVSEYLRLCREIRSFAVYTAKGRKFTLSDSREKNGVAEQMHRGGLSYDTVVMEPRAVRFPHGYFSSVNEQSEADPFLNLILTPLVVLTATFGVAAMVLGASAQEAIESAMIAFFALAPVSVFAVHTLPIEVLSRRLFRRNCTVAGEAMVEKYAACDVLVLHDMHMYREVAASDCGIVIYDKEHALRILACLDALYHVIGGPMRETFSQVGDRVPTPDIQIRRLARNGVEAVTERESLLLGDESFLARYGIAMTEGKGSLGRLGVCRNGKLVAMLRVRYRTEEVFDMLYRNMSASGIGCALQTFDPAISGAFVARTRRSEGLPISVVHRSARALSQEAERPVTEPVGLLAIGSRLKLAECLIYCRKLYRVMKLSHRAQYVAFVLITLGLVALLPFGALGVMHQWWLMLLHAVLSAGMLIPVLCGMPKKQDFMLDATENNEQSKGNTSTQ
ncbi:MAG: hypothetical protein E7664_02250 [Ruminococcaceae bacterium]|nr:hypothetical protein [Oscillospiraceae bacterium]